MKICTRCKKEKPEEEFNFKYKSKGIRGYHCKACSRLYIKNHYKEHKSYYLKKAKKRNYHMRLAASGFLWDYLSVHPCVDCGEADPIVLEFDHRQDKLSAISRLAREATLDKIKLEIKKCDVRCANCHRRRTAKSLGWYKFLEAPVV